MGKTLFVDSINEKEGASNVTTAIEELVGNVLETRFEAFGDELVAEAKNRIVDVISCAIGGANASGNSMIIDLVTEWGGKTGM